jgi:hypothetical protein
VSRRNGVEYKIFKFNENNSITADRADELLEQWLNECGAEGWRLAEPLRSLHNGSGFWALFIMMRERL